MVNFTRSEWAGMEVERKKGQSDSALVRSFIFLPKEKNLKEEKKAD